MDNLDDLMRQKFDSDDPGARFEFREEYWEQAQALLEQDEARQRRRLWIFIGLVLALALLAWLLMLRLGAGSVSQSKQGERDSMGENVPRREESSKQIPLQNSSQSIEIENSDAGKTDSLSRGITQPGAKTESSELRLSDKDKPLQSRIDKSVASKPHNKGNALGSYIQSSKNASGGPTSKSASNAGAAQQSQDSQNDRINADQVDNSLIKSAQSNDQSPIPNHQSPIPNHQSPITTSQSPITNPESPITIPIFYLPIPLTLLKWSERVVAPKLISVPKQPIAEQTKPVQDHRFSLGLSLAGAAYQPSDTDDSWAGWTIGAYGKYHLNKNWALMLGAQGRFIPGHGAAADSSNPNEIEQLRYSFGFKRESWKRETRGLYNLEIPLSAHWHKGPWGLEGGGAAGTLFFVNDRTEYTVETSLEGAKTEIKKLVKGDVAPYNRICFSAFAGASYQLNDRISLMTRGQYRFTPVFKTASEGMKNGGLGNVELGLRARLF